MVWTWAASQDERDLNAWCISAQVAAHWRPGETIQVGAPAAAMAAGIMDGCRRLSSQLGLTVTEWVGDGAAAGVVPGSCQMTHSAPHGHSVHAVEYVQSCDDAGIPVVALPARHTPPIKILVVQNYSKDATHMESSLHGVQWVNVSLHWTRRVRPEAQLFDYALVLCNILTPDVERLHAPVVVMERSDSVRLTGRTRGALSNPLVRRVFKDFVAKDITTYMTTTGRPHYNLLRGERAATPAAPDIGPYLRKIVPVTWNLIQYSFCNTFCKRLHSAAAVKKDIDVFAICHHPSSEPLRSHRDSMQSEVQRLRDEHGLTVVLNQRDIPRDRYFQLLQRSKIAIAPFGYGERIALEQYAVCARTIVVKPRPDTVVAVPDTFSESWMEFTLPDWSELVPDCLRIVENWSPTFQKTAHERHWLARHLVRPDHYRIHVRHEISAVLNTKLVPETPSCTPWADWAPRSKGASFGVLSLAYLQYALNRHARTAKQCSRLQMHKQLRAALRGAADAGTFAVGLPNVDRRCCTEYDIKAWNALASDTACHILHSVIPCDTRVSTPPRAELIHWAVSGRENIIVVCPHTHRRRHPYAGTVVQIPATNAFDDLDRILVDIRNGCQASTPAVVLVDAPHSPVGILICHHLAEDGVCCVSL